jgi:voltage-gated potassium channel
MEIPRREKYEMSGKFQFVVTILTLASVALAIILYVPQIELSNNQQGVVYIADLGIVSILGYDFYTRMKSSNQRLSSFLIKHWYEILAMMPLVLFAAIEEQIILGAVLRSLKLLRLFRLVRLVRLANLFRTIRYLKSSGFVYLAIIFTVTVIFGSIAIYTAESDSPDANIKTYQDALWFAVTTMTISGFGDVYPVTVAGKIISVILIFLGLAVILGFISSLGSTLVVSKLKTRLKLAEQSRSAIKEKIDELEKLEQEDIDTLMGMIKGLHGTLRKQQQDENHQFPPSDGKDKEAGPEPVS